MKILKDRGLKIDHSGTQLSTRIQLIVIEPRFVLYFHHLNSFLKTPCLIYHNNMPLIWQ